MTNVIHDCIEVLSEAGFWAQRFDVVENGVPNSHKALSFENDTILGFVVIYKTAKELIHSWKPDADRVALLHRDALQAARQKAWNTYLVLISEEEADISQTLLLGQIEEDLEAMRKIAKAGATNAANIRTALLPLLPFRSMPSLDPIEMTKEIQARSTEIDADLVAAFLSNAEEALVMQLLEDRA